MRTTIATAAALAAGLTAFAASAEPRQPTSLRASEATYTPAKPLAAAALPKSGSRVRISQRDDSDTTIRVAKTVKRQPQSKATVEAPTLAKAAAQVKTAASAKAAAPVRTVEPAKAAGPKVVVAVQRKKGRERIDLDPVTTAAVARASVPSAAVPSGLAYGEIISRYASAYGVPVSLAHAVIRIESNYRPNTRGSAGEIGLMQIKPATARMMGYSGVTSGLYNPETNIKYGMKYLGMAQDLGGGTTCGTILKYNAGHGARRMNPVSSAYCREVKKHLGQ
jgi:soluble lytic murein transglycosylase-like protein